MPDTHIEILLQLKESMGALHAQYDSLHKELLGNGQPGRVQRLEAKVGSLDTTLRRHDEKLAKHSEKMAFWAGAASIVGIATGILSRWLLHIA